MTLQLNKKEKKILLFLFILIPLLLSLLYFNYVQPLKANVKTKRQQLHANEKLYAAVIDQKGGLQGTIEENTEYLQKRLPVKPLIDQFILDLEKAEILSNSTIVQMGFNSKNEDETTALEDVAALNNQQAKNTEQVDPVQEETLPGGIVKLPVDLLIESPSYYDLEKFLDTVEKLDRIVTVESVNFSGQPEITELQEEPQTIKYQVSLSIYYLPGLADLQKELPKIESGEPANKKNPLSNFDDITNKQEIDTETSKHSPGNKTLESNNETKKSTIVQQSGADQKVVEYTVQANDTLYAISMKFLNSRDGVQIIKSWNGLESDAVYTGQVLKIPLPE
ncbi:type 4a pilus biogenesis protein PilO [Bacillus sp. CGMCC 1.16607]|uniref:LysM peptidoglycan-binding domain-containing protein n=1 Tax=Bacillus sp. CGMCC 1.16607 TaxID=3351842 RepID=UPI003645B48B